MARLAAWLQQRLARRDLTRQAAAVPADTSGATFGDILSRGHLPYLGTSFVSPTALAPRVSTSCTWPPAHRPVATCRDCNDCLVDDPLLELRKRPTNRSPRPSRRGRAFEHLAGIIDRFEAFQRG
jgi:hypothetical protein